jgi:hypothetical protein
MAAVFATTVKGCTSSADAQPSRREPCGLPQCRRIDRLHDSRVGLSAAALRSADAIPQCSSAAHRDLTSESRRILSVRASCPSRRSQRDGSSRRAVTGADQRRELKSRSTRPRLGCALRSREWLETLLWGRDQPMAALDLPLCRSQALRGGHYTRPGGVSALTYACPDCGLVLAPRWPSLAVDYCPRCIAKTRRLVSMKALRPGARAKPPAGPSSTLVPDRRATG